MIDILPKLAMGLGVMVVVAMITLGIAQQATQTVTITPNTPLGNASLDAQNAAEEGYEWFPMLILAIIGGIALAALGRYMGWV